MTRFNAQRQRMIDWKKLLWKWLIPIAVASLCGGLLWSWAGCGLLGSRQNPTTNQKGPVGGDLNWSQEFIQSSGLDKTTMGGIVLVVAALGMAGFVHFKGARTIRGHLIGAAFEIAFLAAAVMVFGIL